MIEVDARQLERAHLLLGGYTKNFAGAIRESLRRAAQGFIIDAARETARKYHVTNSAVKKALRSKWRNIGPLMVIVEATGKRKSLADYKLTPHTPSGVRRELKLWAAVKKDGMKPLKKAFLVKRGGKYKPYVRVSRDRTGILPLVAPSVPQIVKNEETVTIAMRGASERFRKQLDHEILYRQLNPRLRVFK